MAKVKPRSLKTKGRVKTKSQKLQAQNQRQARSNALKSMTDHTSKGTGKYAKRSQTPLKPRQAYKLERQSLRNEARGMETKPEMIKAVGQALSMNFAPQTTTYAATAGTAKIVDASTKNRDKANKSDDAQALIDLIKGGLEQAGRDNDEEMVDDTLPGGANIR